VRLPASGASSFAMPADCSPVWHRHFSACATGRTPYCFRRHEVIEQNFLYD